MLRCCASCFLPRPEDELVRIVFRPARPPKKGSDEPDTEGAFWICRDGCRSISGAIWNLGEFYGEEQ